MPSKWWWAAYAVVQCPSVWPAVCHVHVFCRNEYIFRIFSPSGSRTILVFPYQKLWQYSDGDPPNRGIKCRWGTEKLEWCGYLRWGRQKSRFSTNIWLHPCGRLGWLPVSFLLHVKYTLLYRIHRMLLMLRPPSVIHIAAPDHGTAAPDHG